MTHSVQEIPLVRRFDPVPAVIAQVSDSAGWARLFGMLFAEARPPVQLVFASRVLCFIAVAGGNPFVIDSRMIAATVGWVFLSMAVYLLNGITDITGDKVNSSRRPIAAGRLPVGTATRATAVLAFAGLALCALQSGDLVLVGLALLWLGARYSLGTAPLKSSSTGCAVAVGGGALLSYVAGAVIGGGVPPAAYLLALGLAAWIGLCCATKDFSDVAGDRLAGRRTWPVALGDVPARRLVAALSGTLGAGLFLLAGTLLTGTPALMLPALVGATGAVVLAGTVLTTAGRPRSRSSYRVFMTVQYGVNATLLAAALG